MLFMTDTKLCSKNHNEKPLESVSVFLEQANDQSVVLKTGSQKGLKVHPRPDCEIIC